MDETIAMDRALELVHLHKAEVDIAKARERIECQIELIDRLREHGHDLATANALLQTMCETLAAMEQHREIIVKELG
jgi:hypothetical protein